MHFFKWGLIFLPFVSTITEAQFTYLFDNSIQVTEDEAVLEQAFSGGFISPQFSTIDLDLDGSDDLFVFDRASNKVFTFILKDGRYQYNPFYESLFPANLESWVLLRDFNCDGKMDLFTSSIFGMSLYENTSNANLSWSLKYQTIYTEGTNGQINLQISSLDLPAIVDIDGDGDLDILSFNFATGEEVEFHKNVSVENSGNCGIELVRITKRYGDFQECTCDTYAFGTNTCPTSGKIKHSGSKSILSLDRFGTGVQDLFVGQEYCDMPGFLPNTGTPLDAKMESVSFDFPNASNPLRISFPSFYNIDIYNDGIQDLLVAPNKYEIGGASNYQGLSYLYKKEASGEYVLQSDRFLKEDMIDVGDKASPLFLDLDFDGDQDFLVASGKWNGGASIWVYENIGSPTKPSFLLKTKDYLNLKVEGYESINLQVFKEDDNDFLDLILTVPKGNKAESLVFLHTGNPAEPYSKSNYFVLNLPDISNWDSPYLYSLGSKTALFVGKQKGNLMYYVSSADLSNASWDLMSDAYLGIEEDFKHRNLSLTVTDLNGDGTDDMVLVDDSGALVVYENFKDGSTPETIKGFDENMSEKFNLNFGKLSSISTANIFGKLEPSIIIGLLTGGIQLLTNTQATDNSNSIALKIIAYPNPIQNNQLLLQSNKDGKARLIDASGKQVMTEFDIVSGDQNNIYFDVQEGIYFLEVTTPSNEQQTLRIVVAD